VWARLTTCLILASAAAGCAAEYDIAHEGPAQAPGPDAVALEEAVATIAQSHYAEAAAQLMSLSVRLQTQRDNRRAAESLFWLGYCYEKLGRTGEAAQAYGRVMREYPEQPASHQAEQRLSQMPQADQP